MDKGTVAVEESQRRSDPAAASASKSVGAIVQIDSISIDINCAYQEIEPEEHDKFSIRKFVAGMWEKNWKMCLPFEGDDKNHVMDYLPPALSIPEFRWWKCSTCVSDNADGKNASEMQLVCRNDAGTSSCRNGDKEKDGSHSHYIEQTGTENGSRDSRYREDSDPCNKLVVYSPRGTEIYRPTCNGEQPYAGDDKGGNVVEAIPLQIQESHPNAAVENPSVRAQEPKHDSSGGDHAGGALYKRQKKLRSLVDIMELHKNSTSEKSRMGSVSSSGMQEKSTDIEADLEPPVELDIAKGLKNPLRKKKTVPEEESEQREPANLVSVSKRPKSSTPHAEKTSTRIQFADSESECGASMLLGLRDNAKTLQIKPKKNKPLNTSRKMRKMHMNNITVPTGEVPRINVVPSPILQKHLSAGDAGVGHMGNVPSTLGGEVEPRFPSFLPARQMDRMSNPSMGKKPVFESRYSPLMHRGKSSSEGHNTEVEVALDLSLNSYTGLQKNPSNQVCSEQGHSEIPDLNELFTENTPMPLGNQLSTLSQRSSALLKQLEMTPCCSKDPISEEIRKLGVAQPQAVQNTVNNAETGGASDDIPMDIVELLAMNQRERALGNSKQTCVSQGINSSASGSSAFYPDRRPGINFPFTNASSSSNVARSNVPVSQGIPNFPQAKTCQYGMGNLEGSQFRLFNSFPSSQQMKTQYPPPKFVPRPNKGADLVWPPRQRNVPVHPSITPNQSIRRNALTLHPFPDQSYKGKTISNVKGDGKTSTWDASMVNEGRIGSSSKSVEPVNAYSNDSIPAMQLLSLMDQGAASNSSFKMGPNNFLDKHSSPYSHHPHVKGNDNQNNRFLNASLFSQNSHYAGISRVIDSVYFSAAESLRKPPSQDQTPPEQGSSKNVHSAGPSKTTARPPNNDLELGACTLNRNPADFTTPYKGNEFTISHKHLKPKRKRNAPKETSRPENADGQKKQRARKNSRK